jgi:AbiV family abortive infection protein
LKAAITAQQLYEGSWFALEQAGRLLRQAAALFDGGDHATALALAMFGREELGRSRLLRRCALEVEKGKRLTAENIRDRCDDHVQKQTASSSNVTLQIDGTSSLADAVRRSRKHRPGTDAWKKARALIDMAVDSIRRRQPQDRHNSRMRALYVDLSEDGTAWNRPSDLDRTQACREISDACGDYVIEIQHLDLEVDSIAGKQMAEARAKMSNPPDLPEPVSPQLS